MSESEFAEKRSKPYAKQAIFISFLVPVIVLIVFYMPSPRSLRIPMAAILLIALVYGVGLAIILYRQGTVHLPLLPFLAGSILIGGGAALDGIATLVNTPSLESEGNPIARGLLESGQSSAFVVVYGVVGQILFALLLCTMWAAFLRHRAVLIASAQSKNPKSLSSFIKAALGAAHLSWRQYLLPLKIAELPTSYHTVWAMTAIVTGGSMYRWYLGLAWLGVFPWSYWIAALVISLLLATAIYVLWLAARYKETPKVAV